MLQGDYIKKKVYIACIFLLVLSGLNCGTAAIFKTDAISALLGKNTIGTRLCYVLFAISAIYVGFSRDSYLPFLGETVLPCSVLKEKKPDNAELKVRIIAPVGRKVLYWAADANATENKELKTLKTWQEAYGNFDNAGVTIAGEDGSALLQVHKPQPYLVPMKGRLEPHIHYRICGKDGMMGPVKSIHIEERVEGFGTAIHV